MQAHTPSFVFAFRDETLRRLQRFTPAGRGPCNYSPSGDDAMCYGNDIRGARGGAWNIYGTAECKGLRRELGSAIARSRRALVRTRKLTLITTSSSSTTILEVANLDDLARTRATSLFVTNPRSPRMVLFSIIVVVVSEDNRNRPRNCNLVPTLRANV